MNYVNNTTGESRIQGLIINGLVSLTDGDGVKDFVINGNVGDTGIVDQDIDTPAAVVGVAQFLQKVGSDSIDTLQIDTTKIVSAETFEIQASPTPSSATLVLPEMGDDISTYTFRVDDITEYDTAPYTESVVSIIEGDRVSFASIVVSRINKKQASYDNEGVGLNPRFTIVDNGNGSVTITAKDPNSVLAVSTTKDGLLSSQTTISTQKVAGIMYADEVKTYINQHAGGFNESGWHRTRYEDIGDGGTNQVGVGYTAIVVKYSTDSKWEHVDQFEGTVILFIKDAASVTAIKTILGI